MKKIITALDGLHLSQSAIDYTIFMAKHCDAHIVGVFLDDVVYHGYTFADLLVEGGGVSDERIHELNRRDQKTRDESAALFQLACGQAGLPCTIHRDRNVAIQELLHESIYADLLIIDSKETFARSTQQQEAPTSFLRDLLTDVQCPVLVVPQTCTPVEKLVLLYDGEPSSVHAVKMFSYLLPGLKDAATEVLSIKEDDETLHLPDNRLMKEFMKRHFPDAAYKVLHGDAEKEIITHLQRFQQGALVVLGAYRRSRVSRWFKASMADHLLQNLKLPLFIAHNK